MGYALRIDPFLLVFYQGSPSDIFCPEDPSGDLLWDDLVGKNCDQRFRPTVEWIVSLQNVNYLLCHGMVDRCCRTTVAMMPSQFSPHWGFENILLYSQKFILDEEKFCSSAWVSRNAD